MSAYDAFGCRVVNPPFSRWVLFGTQVSVRSEQKEHGCLIFLRRGFDVSAMFIDGGNVRHLSAGGDSIAPGVHVSVVRAHLERLQVRFEFHAPMRVEII